MKDNKKKILLLGGSAQQIVAIETAKKLGYYTILCDFLPDNPGQYHADKFYLVSTTDKDSVLEVAKEENIDGILAYASDPAAPTAAYIAEKMGLPGNPYDSVETLCNKDKFRKFLKNSGFCTPAAKGYDGIDEAFEDVKNGYYQMPVIVKPVDSSGSKGVTVVGNSRDITEAVGFALEFSRSKRVIIEEFIEKKHPYLIGGDIFVNDGKIVVWGLLNCHRDLNVNPLVPVGKSYPLKLEDADIENVKSTLRKIVDRLGIRFGSMNVELVVDKNGRVFPIDMGPRAGGNMIPDLLGMIFDTDVVEMAVKTAMGEKIRPAVVEKNVFYATHNLHSDKGGIFEKIEFSREIEKYIVKRCIYKKCGDRVEYFDNAAKALGIVFFKFDNMEQMLDMMDHSDEWIQVVIKEE